MPERITKLPSAKIAKAVALVVVLIITVVIATIVVPKPSQHTYVPTPQVTETPQAPPPYVKLSVEAYEAEAHWTRDYSSDLPCYASTIVYTVSNDGTAYADSVSVVVTLDESLFRSVSTSLPPQNYQTDKLEFTFEYDTSHSVSVIASSSTSVDTFTVSVDAALPRHIADIYLAEAASLFITPNDIVVRTTLDEILRSSVIGHVGKWVAIREWVQSHIGYAYDTSVYGSGDYWQLPRETLQLRTGDCEDYAILLASLYRAVGYDADRVFVIIGKNENNEAHGYLRVKLDVIGWVNIEPQAGFLATIFGEEYLFLSQFTVDIMYFNDVWFGYVPP